MEDGDVGIAGMGTGSVVVGIGMWSVMVAMIGC